MTGIFRFGTALTVAVLANAAIAQETTDNRVGASTDWSVFQETDPVECFSVSAPRDSTATRNGEAVEASRSEIQLFVLFRPADNGLGQVTFTGGYPFAAGSTVQLEAAGETIQLMTCVVDGVNKCEESNMPANSNEWAWAVTSDEDARIIDIFKRGSDAILTGQSARGTITRDVFSLSGFTAAVSEAQSRCEQ